MKEIVCHHRDAPLKNLGGGTGRVLSGRFSYSVEGRSTELAPGDSIIVPSGLLHGTVCLEKGVLLDIFTPCRQDFLG